MKIAIIGLGLIGGSLAKTIKKNTKHYVIGIDINNDVLTFAHSVNAIDQIGDDSSLKDADVTIICLYPNAVTDFVLKNRNNFKKGSIVTDAAGVKQCICTVLDKENFDFTFIGGHPMAGREVCGFENSLDDMFDGASYIFTPKTESDEKLKILTALAKEMKFEKIVMTTPKQHDQMIAYTSQIAHVLACAYVISPRSKEHSGFSAGSFRDVSRVAKINEELWTQLFLDNKDTLCPEIDTLIDNLEKLRGFIASDDYNGLKTMLKDGRLIKEELDR